MFMYYSSIYELLHHFTFTSLPLPDTRGGFERFSLRVVCCLLRLMVEADGHSVGFIASSQYVVYSKDGSNR